MTRSPRSRLPPLVVATGVMPPIAAFGDSPLQIDEVIASPLVAALADRADADAATYAKAKRSA